jgi:hypothetical protein
MGGVCSTYGEKRGAYRILVGNLREGDHLGDPSIDVRIILKLTFKKWDVVGAWTGLCWLRIGTGECGNEPLGSVKCGEFLDQLRNC